MRAKTTLVVAGQAIDGPELGGGNVRVNRNERLFPSGVEQGSSPPVASIRIRKQKTGKFGEMKESKSPTQPILGDASAQGPNRFFDFEKKHLRTAGPYLFSVSLSLGFVILFQPGFMSYDTIHAIREARTSIQSSTYPAMVSYIWRAVDLVSPNPSLMHFVQVSLVLVSTTSIVSYFSKTYTLQWLAAPLVLLIPVLSGTLAVIWKDVLTAGLLLGSFAIALRIPAGPTRVGKTRESVFVIALAFFSLVLLFLGISTRHNSFTGAAPFGFFLVYRLLHFHGLRRALILVSALLSALLLGTLMWAKNLVDSHEVAESEPIAGQSRLVGIVMTFDLAGASVCSNTNYLEHLGSDIALDDLRKVYDPRHSEVNSYLRGLDVSQAPEVWLQSLFDDPTCLMKRRWETFAWLIGLNIGGPFPNVHPYLIGTEPGGQYLITHPFVDENEFGFELKPSDARDRAVNYVLEVSHYWFVRPWFIGLFGFFGALFLALTMRPFLPYVVMMLSAWGYAAGIFLAGNASDARLLFFSTLTWLIFSMLVSEKVLAAMWQSRSGQKNLNSSGA